MANTMLVLLACHFVTLAILVGLVRRYDVKWIAKDLQLLDLRVLGEVANGKRFGVGRDRLLRLSKRGFTVDERWGGCRITLKGQYAVFILRARAAVIHDTGPSGSSPA